MCRIELTVKPEEMCLNLHQARRKKWGRWIKAAFCTSVLSVSSFIYASEPFASDAGEQLQVGSIEDVLGKSPKTIFVPGRFYRNGQGALFIDGQRFSTVSGVRDVAGFLKSNSGYLIAVRANVVDFTEVANGPAAPTQPSKPLFTEEELRKLPPEMRLKALQAMGTPAPQESVGVKFGNGKSNATVFYRCSTATSCTIARVVKGLPDLHLTDKTIWFHLPAQSQRVGSEYTSWLLTYSGIDINGVSTDGPNNVLYAAPLPNKEWMIKRLDKEYVSSIDYSWVIRSKEGIEKALFSGTDLVRNSLQITIPTSIAVDMQPISPSAAYGVLSVTTGGYDRTFSETRIYNWPVCATTASKDRMLGTIMSASDSRSKATFIAEQMAFIPDSGKTYAFGQAKIKGNVLGKAEVDCEKAVFTEQGVVKTPYANIEKDGFSFLNGSPKTTGLGGFVHIQSPNGNLILLTDRMKEGKPLAGIRVEDGKRIDSADAQRFMDRYGIVNE